MTKHRKRLQFDQPKPIQDNQEPHDEDTKRNKEHCNASVYMKSGVEIDLSEGFKQQHDTEYGQTTARENRQFWATVGTAILVAIYTGIMFWQGCETKTIITITQQQFQRDQRPYVAIGGFEMIDTTTGKEGIPVVGRPIQVNAIVKNVGKTPAINTRIHRHVVTGHANARLVRAEPIDDTKEGDTLPQGDIIGITAVTLTDTFAVESVDVNASDIVPWDGVDPIIMFGRITYEDRFGAKYCTPFIERYLHDNVWERVPTFTSKQPLPPYTVKVSDLCPPGTGEIY